MMEKEGLQTAIDFTKLIMALAGGGIALIIQPHYLDGERRLKFIAIVALVSLSTCVISGLFVISGGVVRLANKEYSLNSPYLRKPGKISVFSFALGVVLLSIIVGFKIIYPSAIAAVPAAPDICPQSISPASPAPARAPSAVQAPSTTGKTR